MKALWIDSAGNYVPPRYLLVARGKVVGECRTLEGVSASLKALKALSRYKQIKVLCAKTMRELSARDRMKVRVAEDLELARYWGGARSKDGE